MAHNDIITTPVFMDLADWRLIIYLAPGHLQAYLKSTVDAEAPLRIACDAKWEATDPASQLHGLETAVYDRPSLLDDYEADIIIETGATLFVPAVAVEEPGDAEALYSTFYDATEADIFTDRLGAECCLYSPAPGMKPFVERTFPGARVSSALAMLVAKFRNAGEGRRIYAHIRDKEADVMAFDGSRLLCAACHLAADATEAAYHIANARVTYGLTGPSDTVWLSGAEEAKNAVAGILNAAGVSTGSAAVPGLAGSGLPLAAAFCAARPIKNQP